MTTDERQEVQAVRSFLAGLDRRTARPSPLLRRTLLTLILGLVTLSVVGMHQLSLDHSLAGTGQQHRMAADTASMTDHPDATTTATGEVGGQHAGTRVSVPAGLGDADCPDCGHHAMTFGACLLALTLLVLFWRLAPPQVRRLPWRASSRLVTLATALSRRVPALTLAQLSVLRT